MDADKQDFYLNSSAINSFLLHQCKPRPPDRFMLADGTAGRRGEALPLFKGKAAVLADRRGNLEAVARSRGPGNVGQMLQHFLLRQRETLGKLQAGKTFLLQELLDDLAYGIHKIVLDGISSTILSLSKTENRIYGLLKGHHGCGK
jgi:hypothetical protein